MSLFKIKRNAIKVDKYDKVMVEETKKALQEWGNTVVKETYERIVGDWNEKPSFRAEVKHFSGRRRTYVYFRVGGNEIVKGRWLMVDKKGRDAGQPLVYAPKTYTYMKAVRKGDRHYYVKEEKVVIKRYPFRRYIPSTGLSRGRWGGKKEYAGGIMYRMSAEKVPGPVQPRHFSRYIRELATTGKSSNSHVNRLMDGTRARFDLAVRRGYDRANVRRKREAKSSGG